MVIQMADTYRLLITGSRTWLDYDAVLFEISVRKTRRNGLIVVHGAAREGADRFAALAARDLGNVRQERYPANWRRHGKRAGYIRNDEMVATMPDECLAFLMPCELESCALREPHYTHGADHCSRKAELAGIPTRRFPA